MGEQSRSSAGGYGGRPRGERERGECVERQNAQRTTIPQGMTGDAYLYECIIRAAGMNTARSRAYTRDFHCGPLSS
jgi:hypothetical protein